MSDYTGYEIAVIGMAGRFPGAENMNQFWNNLKNGTEAIQPLSEAELEASGEAPELWQQPAYVRANAYLQNKEFFDSAFFNYTPDEARLMDPQIRLLHECVWQAIEDAGYNVNNYPDRIGLFSGATANLNWQTYARIENLKNLIDDYTLPHVSSVNFINTRISYLLNLRGPSVFVNSACSTSLVAIHQACNSLLLGECRIALAGGVTVNNSAPKGYLHREGMILSEDGHCRAFDEAASGTISSEGVGVVVLKRLKKAIDDRDHIYAIIKGTGINNDGNHKVGYTAPSVDGQTEVIMMARKMAKVPAESIGYVEAHGTATKLGDPIEIAGLSRAFGPSREKYCALGSVKTNIGHADAAAGVAGFIKAVLALQHKQIPASLHFQQPNPQLSFDNTPFYVNTELKDWKNDRFPLRAAVSSFGIGGTNAHVILEEAPKVPKTSKSRSHQLLTLSAKSPTALAQNIANLAQSLQATPELELADVAYTLQQGRAAFPYRKAVVGRSTEEMIKALTADRSTRQNKLSGQAPKVVFMFSGQGAQYPQMCRDLYTEEKAFRKEVDHCLEIVQRLSGKDLRPILFPVEAETKDSLLHQTEYTQPALFVIEYALAKLMMSWGIQPDVLIGHSIGEYAAACISGVFSLEDALNLVIRRGALMQKAPRGSMLSIACSEAELAPLLAQQPALALAAINSSEKCVVAGEDAVVHGFQSVLEGKGIRYKMVKTSHAFHSPMMESVLAPFEQALNQVSLKSPQIPLVSTLTGKPIAAAEWASSPYWLQQLRGTVRFSDALTHLFADGPTLLIETGPGRILTSFVGSHTEKGDGHEAINLVRHPRETQHDQAYLLQQIGQLWCKGIEPDWKKYYQQEIRKSVSLPAYAFDRIKYPTIVDSFQLITDMIGQGTQAKQKDQDKWMYRPTWKLSPQTATAQEGQSYLVLTRASGWGKIFAQHLRTQGHPVIEVEKASTFQQVAPGHFQLNPAQNDDFLRLWELLESIPTQVVYAWGTANGQAVAPTAEALDTNLFHLVSLLKSLQAQRGLGNIQLTVLTSGLHAVLEKEVFAPAQALSVGLLKVIPQEFPGMQVKHVDLPVERAAEEKYLKLLDQEVLDTRPGKVVSLRKELRWEQTFEALEGLAASTISPIRNEGVYLITGGLGDLGLSLSAYLLENYQARLLLVGRTPLFGGESGQALHPAAASRIESLRKLGEKGGSVLYQACNIADPEALAEVVAEVEQKWGPVNGVIHAAGVIQGSSIRPFMQLERKDYLAQLEAKVWGVEALKTVFADKELDFCLLTSSLATVLGGLNFAAYATANTYMDYFVQANQQQLPQWKSLNLDGFSLTDTNLINPREIGALIERSLSVSAIPQLTVSTSRLSQRLEKWVQLDTEAGEAEPEGMETPVLPEMEGLSETEAKLLQLWRTFFGKADIEVADSFFSVGGDSIKALNMVGRIQKQLQVSIGIQEFFEYPTVAELAAHLDAACQTQTTEAPSRIERIEKSDFYAASSAQERMLYEQMTHEDSLHNNIPRIFVLQDSAQWEQIQQTFQQLIDRHESLRTIIDFEEDQIVQRIEEDWQFELSFLEESQFATVAEAFASFVQPFELTAGRLFRGAIYRHHQEGTLLMIDTHHVVCDGVGLDVLMKEFIQLYRGETLAPPELRYIDYAAWQKNHGSAFQQQQAYWAEQLAGELPRLTLPILQEREEVEIYAGAKETLHLSLDEVAQLRQFAAEEELSEFMLMLAVYALLLYKMSGDEDLMIGTDALGRTRPEFQAVVGTFINVLPLRFQLTDETRPEDFLTSVKQTVLGGLKHQDFQYEQMYAQVALAEKRPLVDVYFSHAIHFEKETAFQDLGFVPYQMERPETTTRYELELNLAEQADEMILTFLYSTDLYDAMTMQLFRSYYRRILSQLLNRTATTLGEIEVEASVEYN